MPCARKVELWPQPPGAGRLALNTSTNSRPMILRFCSGSTDAGELGEELRRWRRREVDPARAAGRRTSPSTRTASFMAQQAVVDEDAGELVADGAVDERRGDTRVDAARQPEDDLAGRRPARGCVPTASVDVIDAIVQSAGAAADAEGEAAGGSSLPLVGVGDLGMELQRRRSRGRRLPCRRSGQLGVEATDVEAGGSAVHLVAMAGPHLQHALAGRRCGQSRASSSRVWPWARTSAWPNSRCVAGFDLLHRAASASS